MNLMENLENSGKIRKNSKINFGSIKKKKTRIKSKSDNLFNCCAPEIQKKFQFEFTVRDLFDLKKLIYLFVL